MTLDDQVRDHLSRCERQLLTLPMLGFCQDGTELSGRGAGTVDDVTNAVIAEAEAMTRAALDRRQSGQPGSELFIGVRVSRLAMAADQAVSAARSGDAAALRDHLRHFDALASALRAVNDAV